jgi:hypothetical protein
LTESIGSLPPKSRTILHLWHTDLAIKAPS